MLGIAGFILLNFNPYFLIDNQRVYYQRGYVWTLEQKQALISTIYRGLDAGRLIVHVHSYYEQVENHQRGFTDFAKYDILDGKQRLSTVIAFVTDQFLDEFGNYFSELSPLAKRIFWNYQGFSYGRIERPMHPAEIAETFLNNTVSGTPISVEHLNFMKEILKTMKGISDSNKI